jgi:hypothetical protein
MDLRRSTDDFSRGWLRDKLRGKRDVRGGITQNAAKAAVLLWQRRRCGLGAWSIEGTLDDQRNKQQE